MSRLSVNVDHVATLRQARGVGYPDPVEAARIAERSGAHGITVHLRADRRHIQDDDVRRLRDQIQGKLNLEMAATDEMISLASELAPDQVTIVPERPDEITTEGGLDLRTHGERLVQAATALAAREISVSVFLDPQPEQIELLREIGPALVPGFEINTDRYSRASTEEAAEEASRVARCAHLGASHGLRVFAGHGLTSGNVGALAALPEIEEFNIGHSIVSRAVLVGIGHAVAEILSAIKESSASFAGNG